MKKQTIIVASALTVILVASAGAVVTNPDIISGITESLKTAKSNTLQEDDNRNKGISTNLPKSQAELQKEKEQEELKKLEERKPNLKIVYPNGSGDMFIAKTEGETAVFNAGDYRDPNFTIKILKNTNTKPYTVKYFFISDPDKLSSYNAIKIISYLKPAYIVLNESTFKAENTKPLMNFLTKNKIAYAQIGESPYRLGKTFITFPRISSTYPNRARAVVIDNYRENLISLGVTTNEELNPKTFKRLPRYASVIMSTEGESRYTAPTKALDYITNNKNHKPYILLNDKINVDNTQSVKALTPYARKLYLETKSHVLTIESNGLASKVRVGY